MSTSKSKQKDVNIWYYTPATHKPSLHVKNQSLAWRRGRRKSAPKRSGREKGTGNAGYKIGCRQRDGSDICLWKDKGNGHRLGMCHCVN